MNRTTFFTALIAFLAAPFTWAATKLKFDQFATGITGIPGLVGVDSTNKFGVIVMGSGLNYNQSTSTLSVAAAAPLSPSVLVRNTDGTYQYTNGLVYRNGLLQIPGVDFSASGGTLTPIPAASWATDDTIAKV